LHNWQANLEFNFGKEVDVDFTGLLKKLQDIDVVVFVGGLSTLFEGEEMPVSYPGFKGGDRTEIELPAVQRNCLKTLKKAGKKIIYVNCSGSAIALVPESENCEAILQAWYAGESGGQAVADVLFGDYNPSGKLPITFYKNLQQLPDFEEYTMRGRTYRFMSNPLFPFGFGMSYTTFSIGKATLSKTLISADDTIEITVPVVNKGKCEGTEIVQVYVRKENYPDGPLKTLKGFQRVKVAAGRTGQAVISLPYMSFEFFDRPSGKMAVTAGEYEVLYGNSSNDTELKVSKITIQ
jgi:beta-glucosidase